MTQSFQLKNIELPADGQQHSTGAGPLAAQAATCNRALILSRPQCATV